MAERMLGAYRLVQQLAVGGMAEIYAAKRAGLSGFEKFVALKVIHPNFSEDPEFVQMLVDEAKLAVQLQHENIVQTFDLGQIDGQYYIAMELIDGVDLYRLLKKASDRDLRFPFEVAAFIAHEVCAGLDYAHRKRDPKGRPLGIVHRDVSPQNVLVSYGGEVKLVDFGVAKMSLGRRQTAAGVIKGKYYYMSPEQAWGETVDGRADLFACGILMYEMIAGEMLYLEDDVDTLLERVRKANIPSPSTIRAGVPRDLEEIVMGALKKRPDERWQAGSEMVAALGGFLHAYAPDFSRAKLAAFVHEVMGADPTSKTREPRAQGSSPGDRMPADENSLLFHLSDLKPPADAAPPAPAGARQRDQTTRPVSMPEMAKVDALRAAAPRPLGGVPGRGDLGGFEDNDATIVDMSESVNEPQEPTRPMGGPLLRELVSSRELDAFVPRDPAVETSPAIDLAEADESKPPHDARLAAAVVSRVTGGLDKDRARTIEMRKPKSPARPSVASVPKPEPDFDTPFDLPPFSDPGEEDDPSLTPTPTPRTSVPDFPTPPTPVSAQHASVDEATLIPASVPAPLAPPPALTPPSAPPLGGTLAPPPAPPPSSAPPASWPPVTPPPQGSWPPVNAPAAAAPFAQPWLDPEATPLRAESGFSQPISVKPSLSPRLRILIIALAAGAVAVIALAIVWSSGAMASARGAIEIVSLPPGADVTLDESKLAKATPLTIGEVDPQVEHHVRVSMRGYDVWDSDVKFEGTNRRVRLQAVLVLSVGTVEIHSLPEGAEALVNGVYRGQTPLTVTDVPPNSDVSIELRLRGYRASVRSYSWQGQRKLGVTIPLERAR